MAAQDDDDARIEGLRRLDLDTAPTVHSASDSPVVTPSGSKSHADDRPTRATRHLSPSTPTRRFGDVPASEVLPAVRSFFWRVEKMTSPHFPHVDEFCSYFQNQFGVAIPDATRELLGSFNLHVKAVALQPAFCVDTAAGLRLVINEFGVLSMMAVYDVGMQMAEAVSTAPALAGQSPRSTSRRANRPNLLRMFLEYCLGTLYDLPWEAVVVATWNPGNVAVMCCVETDSGKWTRSDKERLQRTFDVLQHHNDVLASLLVQRISRRAAKVGLPVTLSLIHI